MKETVKKKERYLFCVIMGAICVFLLGVSMLTNEMLILKVLFVITLVSYIVLLFCFLMERKRGYK